MHRRDALQLTFMRQGTARTSARALGALRRWYKLIQHFENERQNSVELILKNGTDQEESGTAYLLTLDWNRCCWVTARAR